MDRSRLAGLAACGLLVALAIAAPAASAAVIGFDGVPKDAEIANQFVGDGVTFGPSPPSIGLSGTFTARERSQALSPKNVAEFAYNAGTDFSSSWMRFAGPQTRVAFSACRTGPQGDPPNPNVNILAYDAAGNEIDNQQGIQCTLNGPLVPVVITKPNVTYVNVYANGPGWALDDLEYSRPPKAVTDPASAITTGTATLNGRVNPDGQATNYRFQVGATTAYGTTTPTTSAGSGSSGKAVNAAVAGLAPSTLYHYRLVATNRTGTTAGADSTFTTAAVAGGGPAIPPPAGGANPAPAGGPAAPEPVPDPAPGPAAGEPVVPPAPTQLVTPAPSCPGFADADAAALRPMATAAGLVTGTQAFDRLLGTDGNDTIAGLGGSDCIMGLAGNDSIDGGAGADSLRGDGSCPQGTRDLALCLTGGTGDDNIAGGGDNDRIAGEGGRDRLAGQAGADSVSGGAGNDRISGGAGRDRITGGTGNDDLSGGSGNDRITGAAGRDDITAGGGRDAVSAGSGNDDIRARDGERDQIRCGSGRDRVSVDRRDRVGRDCERVLRR